MADSNGDSGGKQSEEDSDKDPRVSPAPVSHSPTGSRANERLRDDEGGHQSGTDLPLDFNIEDLISDLPDDASSRHDSDDDFELGAGEDDAEDDNDGDLEAQDGEVEEGADEDGAPLTNTVLPPPGTGDPANQAREQAVFDRFRDDFGGDEYIPLPTEGTNLRCGLFAIQRVLRGEDGHEPTMQTLLELARTAADQAVRDLIGRVDGADAQLLALLNNDDYFSVDQLDNFVQLYGRQTGRSMRLGYIGADRHAHILPGANPATLDSVVWIQHTDGGIGHFNAITGPGTRPSRDDYIAQYDENHLVMNFSLIAALFQSFFESQELPDCLKNTAARQQDWTTNANLKNASIEFATQGRRHGFKLNSKRGVTKNSKDNSSDDRTFLQGYFRAEKQITGSGRHKPYTRNISAPELWSPTNRKSPKYGKWLDNQPKDSATVTDPATPAAKYILFRKGTFVTTRRLNDHYSRRSLNLVEMILAFCPRRSRARDIGLVATGADVEKLVYSGLMTDEGVAKLKKMISLARQAKKAKGKSNNKSTSAIPLTLGVRPAGVKSDFCRAFTDLQLDAIQQRQWLRATVTPKTKKAPASRSNSTATKSRDKAKSASSAGKKPQNRAGGAANPQTPTRNRGQTAAASLQGDLRDFMPARTPNSGDQSPRTGDTRRYDQRHSPSNSPAQPPHRVRTALNQAGDSSSQPAPPGLGLPANTQTPAPGAGSNRSSFQVAVDVYEAQADESRSTTRDGLASIIRAIRGQGPAADLAYALAAWRRIFSDEPEP